MIDIDREYEYQPKWWAILFHAGGYTTFAVLCAYTAWRGFFPALYSVVSGLCIALAILDVNSALARLLVCHRVALGREGLILPRSLWSNEEMIISYDEITGLFISSDVNMPKLFRKPIYCQENMRLPTRKLKSARFLYVKYTDGERRIAAIGLPSHAAFEEFCELLMSRVSACQQAGHA
jgi:hypothetical protein